VYTTGPLDQLFMAAQPVTRTVFVVEDDVPAVTVSGPRVLPEGAPSTFAVSCRTSPVPGTTVALRMAWTCAGSQSQAQLVTVTPAEVSCGADVAFVTVQVAEDGVVGPDAPCALSAAVEPARTSDAHYLGVAASAPVTVVNTDVAALVYVPSGAASMDPVLSVALFQDASTGTRLHVLMPRAPTANVRVHLTASSTDVVLSAATLLLTPATCCAPSDSNMVMVSPVLGSVIDGSEVVAVTAVVDASASAEAFWGVTAALKVVVVAPGQVGVRGT
jgi:hypothetical protein